MRVSLLLQREPFAEILEKTLADFFESQLGEPCQVVWREGGRAQSSGKQSWLCNPYLNIIFRPDIREEPLLPAIYEFSRSAKPWRTPLNKLYVALATNRISSRFFANAVFDIEPPVAHSELMVIIGGNHHIRLLDYHQRHCSVISKHGFDLGLMLNDIAVRSEFTKLPAPQILEHCPSGKWYREELILGTPINRLKDQSQAQDAIAQIAPSLFDLYETTRREEDADQYIGEVESHIKLLMERNHLLSGSQREFLGNAVPQLVAFAQKGSSCISTVQAHGDFQPANILVGDGGPWLIDWEYTMRRQLDYDALVFSLYSRKSKCFAQRFRAVLEGSLGNPAMPSEWVALEHSDQKERNRLLSLFLLEELELRLIENDNVLFKFLDAGFLGFCVELETIIPLLGESWA